MEKEMENLEAAFERGDIDAQEYDEQMDALIAAANNKADAR